MILTDNEQKVLDYLRKNPIRFVPPTEIGLVVGGRTKSGLRRHSAWASPICKRLVKKGLVEEYDGRYKVK